MGPVPPPYGGISHWVSMIKKYALLRGDVELNVIDISPPIWRSVDDWAIWKRVLSGGISLVEIVKQQILQLRGRPHLVHLTTSGQWALIRDYVVMRIARYFKIPVFYHIHFGRMPEIARKHSFEWCIFSHTVRLSHTVIAIDEGTKQAICCRLPNVQVVNIPNCINVNALPAPKEGKTKEKYAMFLGWVIPTKGIEELIRAWAEVNPVGWKLLIVGPGSKAYQSELLEKYTPTGVHFLGEKPHSEAIHLMLGATIFVLPSHTEGFPNVVLEAMALRKPIVATRVGAIPEMLDKGAGILVNAQDIIGLKDAMVELLNDEKLRLKIGAEARNRVLEKYSIEKVFSQYLTAWKQVICKING